MLFYSKKTKCAIKLSYAYVLLPYHGSITLIPFLLFTSYSIRNGNKLRGPPKTTLPLAFQGDLTLVQHPIRLHSGKDLAELTELALGRKCWRGLTSQIEKTAEASQTMNWDVKRQYVK